MNRVRYLFKNTGILAISNFASKILVFLLVPLYTSVLTPAEYGVYDLVISTISVMLPILTCNIADAVMRFALDDSYPTDQVVSIGLKYILFSVLSGWIVIILIRIIGIWPEFEGLEVVTGVFFIFYSFNQFLIQTAKGYERIFDMGVAAVIGTVVMILGNILFLLIFKYRLLGFFYANILAQAIPVFYLSLRLKIFYHVKSILNQSKTLQIKMLRYSIPLIATVIGWWVNSASDRYVVAFICGVSANGLLSVSYKIPSIVNTLQAIFTQAWQISAIKEYETTDKAVFYGKTLLILNLLVSFACSTLIILTKPLAVLLYSNDFYDAWKYVPFLLISCVINSASGILGPILSAKKDSKSMALSALYGASTNIALNVLLVFFIGVQGACIATVFASFIIYIVRKKAVGNEIAIENDSIIMITWLLLSVQAVIEIVSKAWWCEFLIIGAVVLINRSIVADVLKISKTITQAIVSSHIEKQG